MKIIEKKFGGLNNLPYLCCVETNETYFNKRQARRLGLFKFFSKMKNLVAFLKGITVADFFCGLIMLMVGLLTAMRIIFLPSALVANDFSAAVITAVTLFGTIFFFWIPWYMDKD